MDIYTDDHIFFEAIGGRRTIRACKGCNDRFGHSFEAQTIQNNLHPLLVLLGDGGVSVLDPGAKWKNAFVGKDGLPYHLTLGPHGMVPEGARIAVERDPSTPNMIRVTVNEDAAAPKLLHQFSNSKKFHLTSRVKLPPVQNDNVQATFNMGNAMRMTALKMAFAVATIALPTELDRFVEARKNLGGSVSDLDQTQVRIDHRDHPVLDRNRKPLCHAIYVEQAEGIVHGVVQFFGSFQFWVKLSSRISCPSETAMIATLDPISGIEEFREIPRLGIPVCKGDETVDSATPIRKFNLGAAWRGAKKSEILSLTKITTDDGTELFPTQPYSAVSWTGDVPKLRR